MTTIVTTIVNFLVQEVLSQAPLLIGLIALIGLISLRRNPIKGTVRSILGFIVLAGGAAMIIPTLTPLAAMVQVAFHLRGVIPSNEAVLGLAQKSFGAQTAQIMALGFLVNVVLARTTLVKYIFLTGQHLLFMATVLAVVLGGAGITGIHQIVIGALILGVAGAVMPALIHPFTRTVTRNLPPHERNFTLGHFNSSGYILSALVGRLVGRGSRSTEEIQVPEWLQFLQEPLVLTTITMLIIYIVLAVVAGPTALNQYDGGHNYVAFAILEGLAFGAGVAVVLYGVGMILGEIVPAFQGIARKVVPNSVPALDCPTVFPAAPNAVVVGFIMSLAGGIVGLFLLGAVGLPLVLPGLVAHFFDGGTAGVFGNSTGGRRGAFIGAFVNGLLITFLPALLLSFLSGLGLVNASFGDSDFAVVGILAGLAAKTGVIGSYAIIVPALVVLVVLASFITRRFTPSTEAEEANGNTNGNGN